MSATPATTPRPHVPRAPLFRRSQGDRVLAGVAGGLAERLGIDAVVVRLAFAALAFAGGFGVLLYVLAWLLSSEPVPATESAPATEPQRGIRPVLSVAFIVMGLLLILRSVGVWFGDALVWPVAIAALGSAVIWTRSGNQGRARFSRLASRLARAPVDGRIASGASSGAWRARLLVGGLLIVAGVAAFLAANDALVAVRNVAIAIMATASGAALILGPGIWQLGRQLTEERRERIRSQERAEMAAHLHDSVLQTLAMIQRASSPKEMVTLARGQERELRGWLYGRPGGYPDPAAAAGRGSGGNGSVAGRQDPPLSVALDRVAATVEERHRVSVDVVTVGECAVDDRVRALIESAGEAMSNAARHSGEASVAVYAEVGPDAVSVFVRDWGSGFDPASIPAGRIGIKESILGRMERHGGTATVVSEAGRGTEWDLRLPVRSG
jgi:signal transduction histidine kinase/phage shock protein PspC (stress-responsive transcriptional regulator)